MFQLRIIGFFWLLFGVFGACWLLFDIYWNVTTHVFTGGVVASDFIALAFCVLAVFAGYGALRRRRWARAVCGVVGVLLFLYSLSYLSMVGLEFGPVLYAVIWTAALFSFYSLVVIVRYGRTA
jgi:hypothetical protein